MERILQFAELKATGKLWILLSENVRIMHEECCVFKYSELVFQTGEHHMFRNEARTKMMMSTVFRQKQTRVEPMSETVWQFFFFLHQNIIYV